VVVLTRRQYALALAVFVLAWVWLSLRPSAPLQEDTSRDLAFARDLVDGAVLHRHGAWASFAALQHGSGWVDFLAACQLAGLGIVGIERVLTVLLAASVAVAYLGFSAALPSRADDRVVERAALCGALVLLASLPFVCEMPILWPAMLLPAVVVLAHLSLWRLLRDGKLVDALALAILCALTCDLQLIGAVLVLLALAAVVLASERPFLATALSIALGVATAVLCSAEALATNVEILRERGWLVSALAVPCVFVIAGALARRRFVKLDWEARLRLALGVELMMLALMLVAALVLSRSTSDVFAQPTGRYLLPFMPAVALAAALASSWARSPRSAALSLGFALVLVSASLGQLRPKPERVLPIYPEWRVAEFAPVAAALVERDSTWTDLALRLSGPSHAVVLGYLSSIVEPGSAEPARPDAGLLLLALAPADALDLADELPAERVTTIELDDLHAMLIDTPARTDRRGAQLCRDGQACQDVVLAATRRTYQAQPSAWVGVEQAGTWLRAPSAGGWQEGEPREIQWKFPVAAGAPVVLMLTSVLPEHCAWFFVATDGFPSSTSLPSHVLELPAHAQGTVLISRRLAPEQHACREHNELPPAIIETAPEWTRLRELLAPPW
jgi:hypothetical protein